MVKSKGKTSSVNFDPTCLVIPAAGLGTRMKGVDPSLPKEMLPLGGRPAIQYAVEEGIHAGIGHIVIILREGKESIRSYLEGRGGWSDLYTGAADSLEDLRARARFTFLYQKSLLGECDAIRMARDAAAGGCVAIIYPDNICLPAPGVLEKLLSRYRRLGGHVLALMEVGDENKRCVSNSGRVDLEPCGEDLFRVKRFLAKGDGWFEPRYATEYRACGISIAAWDYFQAIEDVSRLVSTGELTDEMVRTRMLEKGTVFYGLSVPGNIYDVGNPSGYRLCQSRLCDL
jgi:UTP--glucose-1-phosphate uridylyltransferase